MKNTVKKRSYIYGIFVLQIFMGTPVLQAGTPLPAETGMQVKDQPVPDSVSRSTEQVYGTVSGQVTNMQGQPLPGVTIAVKGTTAGTITDVDGNYHFINVPDDAILIFSFVGMKAQEIAVNGRPLIHVTLEEETIGLEEVVAIGYGTVRKKDVTGSVSSVSGNQLAETATFSAAQALQGKAAGVVVQRTNAKPGADHTVMIRGNRSLKATNNPLYVVDGIPLVVGLSEISGFMVPEVQTARVEMHVPKTAMTHAPCTPGKTFFTGIRL